MQTYRQTYRHTKFKLNHKDSIQHQGMNVQAECVFLVITLKI